MSLLLALNIVVSCLVICFSCGLYSVYKPRAEEGGERNIKFIRAYIESDDWEYLDDANIIVATKQMTPKMFTELLLSLSDETQSIISSINAEFWVETPFCYFEGIDVERSDHIELAGRADIHYSENADPFYWPIDCWFKVRDGKIVDSSDEETFSYEQYNSGDKIVAVSDEIFLPYNDLHQPEGLRLVKMATGHNLSIFHRIVPRDTEEILLNGARYKIVKIYKDGIGLDSLSVPITALPESALLDCSHDHDDETSSRCFGVFFDGQCTREKYNEIQNRIHDIMGSNVNLEPIVFIDSAETDFYNTVVVLSIVISVLAAVNMAILYRYILEKRSGDLAIMRICGCTKRKAAALYLAECMIINIPLFLLTQLCFHKFVLPGVEKIFPQISEAYSKSTYITVFVIFFAVAFIIMRVMISRMVNAHSLVEVKNSHHATSRLGIMKVFEIIQLAAVLVIMVLVVSAIESRYSMFTPFEKYLSRDGYMVTMDGVDIYPKDIKKTLGDTEYICNVHGNTFDGKIEDGKELNIISYSDEFMEAYAPPIDDGVWLDEVDFTFKDSGYIPAVVTSCDGRYKVGDTIECDVIMGYDENGEPTNIINAKYKIVGVTKDRVSIASYVINNNKPKDYSDIYSVFRDDFEEKDWLLTKKSDEFDCYSASGPAYGAMFIFCDDMTDEEYRELSASIEADWQKVPVPLSTIYDNSKEYIYEQMYTLFPIAVCIFILTVISTVSINAIYTKRQLRNYAIFYICGAKWRTCALKSLKNGAITCAVSAALSALILIVGKATLLKETVISFGLWHFAVCAGVIVLYLALSMIMPLSIIGSAEPREVLKEE